jgi:hypothetical protein
VAKNQLDRTAKHLYVHPSFDRDFVVLLRRFDLELNWSATLGREGFGIAKRASKNSDPTHPATTATIIASCHHPPRRQTPIPKRPSSDVSMKLRSKDCSKKCELRIWGIVGEQKIETKKHHPCQVILPSHHHHAPPLPRTRAA